MDSSERQINIPIYSPNMPAGGKFFVSQTLPPQPKKTEISVKSKNQKTDSSNK